MKKLIVVLILLIASVLTWRFFFTGEESHEFSYTEYEVGTGDIELTVNATGVVQPENRLEIKPPIAGRVESILVEEGQLVKRGEILAWLSSTERAALLDSARSMGEKEVKKWEELYRPTPIMAPIDGTIIQRNVEPGQSFTNADVIFAMSDRLAVLVNVDETDIAQVKVLGATKITLDAYPDTVISGKVSHIAYEASTVNNVTTYKVNVIPDTIPSFMRSGMTVNVYFLVQNKKDIVVVPAQALDGNQVMLSNQTLKTIELGIDNGSLVEVLSGLTIGDTILIKNMQISSGLEKDGGGTFMFGGRGGRGMRR